ncbi:hypothetical protein VNI00_014746 [Paramarasmius palmivorus]|uniref:Uncharacterized protein n=1 Tax=Paramarasmius palmivorus TaxID=297713 RepID=A0AAW0BQR0_9AGAR
MLISSYNGKFVGQCEGHWQVGGMVCLTPHCSQLLSSLPQYFGTQGRVSLVDEVVYVRVGEHFPQNFPILPPKLSLVPESQHSIFDFQNPRWMFEDTPYLAFVPARNPLASDWLKPLNHTFRTLPIILDTNGQYKLAQTTIDQWESLEVNLHRLYNRLIRSTRIPLSPRFRLWPWPRQFGYIRKHKSEAIARFQALASRDAFMALLGIINFFARYFQYHQELILKSNGLDVAFTIEEVLEFLQQDAQISAVWMNDWRSTAFESPYIGAFIDVSQGSGCFSYVPVMARFNIPSALSWGSHNQLANAPRIMDDYIPTHDEIAAAMRVRVAFATQASSEKATKEIPARLSSLDFTPMPPVNPGTGQLPNEHYVQFFKRREASRDKYLLSEGPEKRVSRLQREAHSQKDLPPGKRGAVVFYWVQDSGHRIRTFAGRDNYDHYWSRYTRNQRRYDSVRDEWDVCTEFGEDDARDFEDGEDEGTCTTIQVDDHTMFSHVPDTAQKTSTEYVSNLYCRADEEELQHNLQLSSIQDIARYRFGMITNSGARLSSSPVSWPDAEKFVGAITETTSPEFRESFRAFISVFHSHSDLLSINWFDTLDLFSSDEDSMIRKSWPFKISTIASPETKYYLLHWDHHDEDFQLAIPNAASVLEVVRRGWGLSAKELIPKLIDRGMAFRTFFKTCEANRPRANPRFRSPAYLGYRTKDYKFESIDYITYTHHRNRFLHTPRGHAALRLGGIVGRIARGVISWDGVIARPAESATELRGYGDCVVTESAQYWDDYLTEEELDLVCGVYDVQAEKKRDGTFTVTKKSWWPKPNSWRVSGLNVGYWSSAAEVWFQARLKQIESGSATLYNGRGWKDCIKYVRRSNEIAARNENLADQFLDLCPRVWLSSEIKS